MSYRKLSCTEEKTDKIDDIHFYKNRFIDQINTLFADSKKRIDFDELAIL